MSASRPTFQQVTAAVIELYAESRRSLVGVDLETLEQVYYMAVHAIGEEEAIRIQLANVAEERRIGRMLPTDDPRPF